MSILMTKTSQPSTPASGPGRPPERSHPSPTPRPRVDTSNLSPGAAARFEKLLNSIDDFTDAVRNKAITPPERK
jgi:hypothetical protein